MSTKKELEQPWSLKKIDAHVAKYAVTAKSLKGKDVQTTICGYYTAARPIIVYIGNLLGKIGVMAIVSLIAGLDAYCAGGIQAKSVGTTICKAWSKVSGVIDLVLQFLGRAGWVQAIKGLSVALTTFCANQS